MPNQIRPDLPRLIILEGPAGVGKTSLSHYLQAQLSRLNVSSAIIPEFSISPMGNLLEKSCPFGSVVPEWLCGLEGSMAFLSDKLYSIQQTKNHSANIWIADRFTVSQLILGVMATDIKEERETLKALIRRLTSFAACHFSSDSLFVCLDAPFEVLTARLERRMKRKFTTQELEMLEHETSQFRLIGNPLAPWEKHNCTTLESLEKVGDNILNHVKDKWRIQ